MHSLSLSSDFLLPTVAGLALLAYLMGSLSTAIIVCRLLGYPDPRTQGSSNPGATNVLRIAGKPAAAMTLAGDVLKGVIPVLLAKGLGLPALSCGLVGVAAFIGHLYPVFFRFQGGKGVATALGVITTLHALSGLAVMATWLAVFIPFRISSLSSISSWLAAPFIVAYLAPGYLWPVTVMSIILIARHHQNIRDLLSGRESSFRKKENP